MRKEIDPAYLHHYRNVVASVKNKTPDVCPKCGSQMQYTWCGSLKCDYRAPEYVPFSRSEEDARRQNQTPAD